MSAIKAGDLVMVVRPTPCCHRQEAIGYTFVVSGVDEGMGLCAHCGWMELKSAALDGSFTHGYRTGYQFSRLIKIDPPAEPESTTTDREVTA